MEFLEKDILEEKIIFKIFIYFVFLTSINIIPLIISVFFKLSFKFSLVISKFIIKFIVKI